METLYQKIKEVLVRRRTAISYTTGSLFNAVAQLISNIVILAYVGPGEMGIWNSLILFQTYSLFLQSGVINGLNRELPYYLGKNDRSFAESLASTALYYFIISIIVCFLISLVLFVIKSDSTLLFHLTIIGVVIITLTKFYEDYLTSTFRSDHAFEKLAKAYLFRGCFLLISILIVVIWGYYGYLVRMVLTSILFTFFLHRIRPIQVKPVFNKSNFILLLKVGMPIFILAYIFTVSGTFDRVLLVKKAGFTLVGYYSLALMAYNAFKTFPVSVANYIYPKMSYEFGQTNDKDILTLKAIKINLVMLLIMLPVAVAGFFLVPLLIPVLFPQYIHGITGTQILLFAAVFSGASIGINVIWSMKIWKYIYISQIGGAILNLILIYTGFRVFKEPIIGVSIGVLCSQVIYMIMSNYFVYVIRNHEGAKREVE